MRQLGYHIVVLLIFLGLQIACNQTPKKQKNSDGTAQISFQHTEFDFGTVQMGENVVHDFVFTNTGTGDLYIKNIKTDCGCTVAKFSKEAIKPNEKSTVEVMFASEGFPGFQTKKVTVFTNAKDSAVLRVSAIVDFKLISTQ